MSDVGIINCSTADGAVRMSVATPIPMCSRRILASSGLKYLSVSHTVLCLGSRTSCLAVMILLVMKLTSIKSICLQNKNQIICRVSGLSVGVGALDCTVHLYSSRTLCTLPQSDFDRPSVQIPQCRESLKVALVGGKTILPRKESLLTSCLLSNYQRGKVTSPVNF